MKRVFIDITGVLRDTYAKMASEYRKYYIETESEGEETFEYDMVLPMESENIIEHFKFQSEDEMKYFMFMEFAMEIFGHSAPVYGGVFTDLTELIKTKTEWNITIVSDEIGKGKPASLFFLSKNSCYVDNYRFYKKDLVKDLWGECDMWITSNNNVLVNKPEDKISVKINTDYNKNNNSNISIDKLGELIDLEL